LKKKWKAMENNVKKSNSGNHKKQRENAGESKDLFGVPASQINNNTASELLGMPVTKIFEIDKNHADDAEETENHVQRRQLIHNLFLLFYNNEIDHNTKTCEQQGQKYSPAKSHPGKRGFDNNPEDQHSKAQFGCIIKEFCQIIADVLFHGGLFYRHAPGMSR